MASEVIGQHNVGVLAPHERFRGQRDAPIRNNGPAGNFEPQKPCVGTAFPAWRYHKTKGAVLVQNPDDEVKRAPAGSGWSSKPFPPKPEAA